jgi:AAA domain
VIVIDEASTTATLDAAQLAELAQTCGGKLVLIGDPRQIGAVGPGGLFGHLTHLVEPARLTEIRRQQRELDRRVVELAHAGRGSDALDLLRAVGRVHIADTIDEARRAAVLDWHRAYSGGADAVMIARRNRDVEELNAAARELLVAEGRVGEEAVRVGAREFAVGDRVLTRINARGVSNRERFEVTGVDAELQTVELRRIRGDERTTVTLGSDYLERLTPGGDPALEHAYALTIYGSEAKTFDRSFALLDAGASQEELVVAVSRAREATLAYGVASLELTDPGLGPGRRAIEDELHELRAAAERPRAGAAAAEVALRERIAQQEVAALRARQAELEAQQREAQRPTPKLGEVRELEQRIEWADQRLRRVGDEREALQSRWRRPKDELARLAWEEEVALAQLRRLGAERERLAAEIARFEAGRPPALDPSRRLERELIGERLQQLVRREVAAERPKPSAFVREALGPRPSDRRRLEAWNQGVQEIHAYRQAHAVRDPERALGAKPTDGAARAEWRAAQQRLRQRQLELGLERALERRLGRELGLSLEL